MTELRHLPITRSKVARARLARLEWIPRQAKLPVHGAWRWTWEVCHWPWKVKSTIKKSSSSIFPNAGKTGHFQKKLAVPIFGTAQSRTRTILDHGKLSQGCNSCAVAFGVGSERKWAKWPAHLGRFILAPSHCKMKRGMSANGKTRVASKTSKRSNAWWVASNWRSMPLAIKCQINNQNNASSILSKTKVDDLQKSGGYLQLRSYICLYWTISY